MSAPAEVKASWSISLDVMCPNCAHGFDLVSELSGKVSSISPLEYNTARTDNYETSCPECKHEFVVCFEY